MFSEVEVRHTELDDRLERQIVRAANRLAYQGRYVANPMLATCAEIMLKDFDVKSPIPGCSNGALRCALEGEQRFARKV